VVRTMSRNAHFGERAVLMGTRRTATVEVSSQEAELWCLHQTRFLELLTPNMREERLQRLQLQDTSVALTDLRCKRVVGEGGMGIVTLVEHITTGMRYALKRCNKFQSRIPMNVRREMDLLAENDHPFIIKFVKSFETEKHVYLLTELISGGELFDALRTIPRALNQKEAQFYIGSLLLVLDVLRDRGVVYRDLKPENVMLDSQGYTKLVDFGIAKKFAEDVKRTFTVVGTPHYMAPEILTKSGYGMEVDVWSLGVMFYELVCVKLPFGDDFDQAFQIYDAVKTVPLTFPDFYREKQGRQLIKGLLQKDPTLRLGAGEADLERLQEHPWFTGNLFERLRARELRAPVIPCGEQYSSAGGEHKFPSLLEIEEHDILSQPKDVV